MTTTTSRPVSIISHNYNTNPVIDARPAGSGACARRSAEMKMKRLAGYSPVLLSILLAIVLTAVLHSTGKGLVASALMGSATAVLSVWFAFFSMYRLTMFVTRGAPFRVGDSVRVTDGDFAGKRGTVTKLVDGFPAVFLKLDEESSDSEDRYFDWNQVSRRSVTNNGRTRRPS